MQGKVLIRILIAFQNLNLCCRARAQAYVTSELSTIFFPAFTPFLSSAIVFTFPLIVSQNPPGRPFFKIFHLIFSKLDADININTDVIVYLSINNIYLSDSKLRDIKIINGNFQFFTQNIPINLIMQNSGFFSPL